MLQLKENKATSLVMVQWEALVDRWRPYPFKQEVKSDVTAAILMAFEPIRCDVQGLLHTPAGCPLYSF